MEDASKGVTLIVVAIGSFLTPYMSSAVNVALPSIGTEFNIGATTLSWIATAYLLAAAIVLFPFGKLADIFGRKKVFAYGVAIYTLAALLLANSTSEMELIFFRVIEGCGAAMLFSSALAMLTSVFPPGERGTALGINTASVYFGLSLGPFLGGFLTQHYGWRSVFLIVVPLGILILLLISWKLKGEWAEARGESFDIIGSVIYGLALGAMILGVSFIPAIRGVWLICTGILLLIGFIYWENKIETPILDISLFKNNRVFTFSNLAALLNFSSTYAVVFFLSLYLQYIRGFTPEITGIILIAQPAVQAIISPFAGRLSDRIEPRIVASIGMIFTVLGLISLISIDENTDLRFVIGCLVLFGLGFALFASPNTNAIMSAVPRRFYGVASGTIGTMRLTGQMFSQGIAMLVLAFYLGTSQITSINYALFLDAMDTAFTILSILCTVGIFFSLARGKMRPE